MSEYQYYEFQAIDNRLNEKEMAEISKLSSRVELSPTQAIFTYSYSDFRGDPLSLVEKYFDMMLYVANFGMRQMILKIPLGFIELKDLKPFCVEDHIEIYKKKNFILVNISLHQGDGADHEWIEGEGMLSSMANLRNDIMMGDFRVLYLAFLKALDLNGDIDEDEEDEENKSKIKYPPIPPNLKKLNPALKAFIETFEVYEELFEEAKQLSENKTSSVKLDIEKLIPMLTVKEKNNFLISLANNEKNVSIQLMKKLNQIHKSKHKKVTPKKKKVKPSLH